MSIPAIIFLLVYILVVLILFVFMIFNIYHVIRYAFNTKSSVVITILFIVGLILIISVSVYYISQIDWSQAFRFSII